MSKGFIGFHGRIFVSERARDILKRSCPKNDRTIYCYPTQMTTSDSHDSLIQTRIAHNPCWNNQWKCVNLLGLQWIVESCHFFWERFVREGKIELPLNNFRIHEAVNWVSVSWAFSWRIRHICTGGCLLLNKK